ncbi:efflux RND transporter periplasmic adaptor subunit [Ruminococcus sp.]|uniref:efflux RND transporter periplasmic adaptor subunit n=1 Tax=Ruminococcus sp. TaxID=41978 RepID=UPI001B74A0FC|nr:efflux RND transporter periplasmic adaptor subunit [Ruminococcus sp.]MBP5433454.1 efflux RND transporter periplasmic adaptor subunit [Ruminococcus sp.]
MGKTGKIIKRIVIFLVILLILGGIAFFVRNAIRGAATKVSIRSDTCGKVKRQDLISYSNMSGTISSSDKLMITADPTLKVKKLNVKVGDSVKAGDILCEFDSAKLQEEYDAMALNNEKVAGAQQHSHDLTVRQLNKAREQRSELISKAQNAINTAVEKRDKAYDEYGRRADEFNKLYVETNDAYNAWMNSGSEESAQLEKVYKALETKLEAAESLLESVKNALPEYDEAVKSANEAYSQAVKSGDELVQSAQDAIDAEKYSISDNSAEKQLAELAERIEKCVIKAEKDGVVTELNISEGSVPMSANIMTIENTSELVVAGKVSESDILKLSEGMEAEIKTSATEDLVIKGTVKRIERIVSSNSAETKMMGGYTVEVSIDDNESGLLIGMSANVKIILDKRVNVLSVPYNAVSGGENEGYFVFTATPTAEGDYLISKRSVSKGFEGDFYTEITSGGLKEGDIVVTDPRGITDGDIIPLKVPED